jgi:hypothetical protein
MITTNQINYVAGLLEGEGCFFVRGGSAGIHLTMTDEDVVRKVKSIISPKSSVCVGRPKYYRQSKVYTVNVTGFVAIQWMLTIYTLMGKRRKNKILEIISAWKNGIRNSYKLAG